MPARLSQTEVLRRFRLVHGRRYDYSRVAYVGSHRPVEIVCRGHGRFRQSPSAHIHQKQGCPTCASLLSKREPIAFEEFVRRSRRKHGNRYRYYKKHYTTLNAPTVIHCTAHNERFSQLPAVHVSGCTGCKSCTQEKLSAPRLTVADWVERFRRRHGRRYSYPQLSEGRRSDLPP